MRAAGLSGERLSKLVCPIGLAEVKGKDPAVIAASTAAQLLMISERFSAEYTKPRLEREARRAVYTPRT
jgi:xanthine/CO dehydrogenase XdhC/CoxF family maturation factor